MCKISVFWCLTHPIPTTRIFKQIFQHVWRVKILKTGGHRSSFQKHVWASETFHKIAKETYLETEERRLQVSSPYFRCLSVRSTLSPKEKYASSLSALTLANFTLPSVVVIKASHQMEILWWHRPGNEGSLPFGEFQNVKWKYPDLKASSIVLATEAVLVSHVCQHNLLVTNIATHFDLTLFILKFIC